MRERMYFVYMLASRSRTLYIGVTGDLMQRVFQHKAKMHHGFTERYNCDRLIWFERFGDVGQAIGREKELKGWTRAKKIALIEADNPTWDDLSEAWYPRIGADHALREADPSLRLVTPRTKTRSWVPEMPLRSG